MTDPNGTGDATSGNDQTQEQKLTFGDFVDNREHVSATLMRLGVGVMKANEEEATDPNKAKLIRDAVMKTLDGKAIAYLGLGLDITDPTALGDGSKNNGDNDNTGDQNNGNA